MRQGIIVKEKPKWVPGVTSAPLQEKCYPQEPVLAKLKDAVFHPKKVTHVALVARNFEAMFDFYVNSVGLTALVGDRDSDLALLKGTASDGDVTLYRAGAGVSPGLHHVGFEVWDEDDLERSIAALPDAGVRVEKQVDHPARRSIVIKAPVAKKHSICSKERRTADGLVPSVGRSSSARRSRCREPHPLYEEHCRRARPYQLAS
ncbi:MAG: hypothetical protein E6G76_24445 [Alphaproteobacteria bacterium]|nr:MAG: hypothetical protein E6G76_24445 [Alphaproteobacteria bacterium]